MRFDISSKVIAVIFIMLGIAAVFMLMGDSLYQHINPNILETVIIQTRQGDRCIVEPSDGATRSIDDCPYAEGENITISYKTGLPSIESHQV